MLTRSNVSEEGFLPGPKSVPLRNHRGEKHTRLLLSLNNVQIVPLKKGLANVSLKLQFSPHPRIFFFITESQVWFWPIAHVNKRNSSSLICCTEWKFAFGAVQHCPLTLISALLSFGGLSAVTPSLLLDMPNLHPCPFFADSAVTSLSWPNRQIVPSRWQACSTAPW